MEKSYFDGSVLSRIGIVIFGTIITIITLGICFPVYYVMMKKYEINHTVINGKRLNFSGTASGLFGNYIKWYLLFILTLGIYGFWIPVKLLQWETKHSNFRTY